MEKVPVKGDSQERRTALGKKMGYDVGKPEELIESEEGAAMKLPNGDFVKRRDAVGLLVDPAVYAKQKCNKCHGRGIITLQQPVAKDFVEKMRADPTASALLHENRGSYSTRETERCMCAVLGYAKAVTTFSEALLKEGLARRTGWVKEHENAMARQKIELV